MHLEIVSKVEGVEDTSSIYECNMKNVPALRCLDFKAF